MEVLIAGLAVQLLGGIAAFALCRRPRLACATGAAAAIAGAVMGLGATGRVLLSGVAEELVLPWDAAYTRFMIGLDSLGAVFLLPVQILTVLCAIYGANYLLAYRRTKPLGPPWFFFNLFVAGMVGVIAARTLFLFLVAWEVMSLAAYFLVTFEHEKESVRRAGWVYLIAAQLGAACLLAAFAILGSHTGSLEFAAIQGQLNISGFEAGAVFLLALAGFGAKAGLVPFHVWLPEAHPAAPSHVSALMSGVMIKMGLYGLLRVLTFLGQPAPWWGLTLAVMGMITALVGISLALHQRDIKRVLAYSSIENMGLIALSLGVGLWGQATNRPVVAALGMAGGLLHVWNHAAMKGLMFLAAGSILHGTGTRDIERLGGLMKRMPWTGSAMMVGAVAIAALPPLNGFASKLLMYLALLEGGLSPGTDNGLTALLAVSLLAFVGSLALAAFVRLVGIALLGTPRSEAAATVHESSPWMLVPIGVLVALCLSLAVMPAGAMNLLTEVRAQLQTPRDDASWEAFSQPWTVLLPLGTLNGWLLATIALAALLLMWRLRRSTVVSGPTWGCGYAQPTPRMQYTGRSFAEILAEHLLIRFLRPRISRKAPEGLFPAAGEFASQSPDPVSEKVYEPFFARWARRFTQVRILQQGHLHFYLMYVLFTVVLALAWVSLRTWWGAGG